MRVRLVIILLFLISSCSAFDVTPSNPMPGDKITISGSGAPGSQLEFRSSFSMNLPVSNGQYEYESNVEVPQKPNRFAVSARNVKDLNLGVKMIIWITKRIEANGGTASVSQSDVPPGRYDLKMFGTAEDGASSVPVDVSAKTTVNADSDGKYSLILDTSGMPGGDYIIEGAGDVKTIHVGSSEISSESGSNSGSHDSGNISVRSEDGSNGSPEQQSSSKGLEVTSDVIEWYAGMHGMDPKNSAQYAEAKRQIGNMISGGYWKIIAKGSPLTEQAGNCEDRYCIVRGKDACTVCREEEIATASSNHANTINIINTTENKTPENASTNTGENMSATAQPSQGGFINSLIDWIWSLVRGWIK
jgi:hypothetical protein